MTTRHLIIFALTACGGELDELAEDADSIRGGTTVSTGALEAVVQTGNLSGGMNCSGTLITNDAVLFAAHCVCGGNTCPTSLDQCQTRRRALFNNVRRVGSTTRVNVSIDGDVVVHPGYCADGWLWNDYAIIRLDTPADEVVQVAPIFVENATNLPAAGQSMTLVGYGGTHSGSTNNCNGAGGVKRSGVVALDEYKTYTPASGGASLVFDDLRGSNGNGVGACPGDSGGPAINTSGRVVGVASHGNGSTNSSYDATRVAWDWIAKNACPAFDPTNPDPGYCSNPLCPCVSAEGDCDGSSQCIAGAQCVGNVGEANGMPSHYDMCWASDQLVTVYSTTSYGGASQPFPVGSFGSSELTVIGNDQVGSLVASPGLTVRLCAENGAWGNCQKFSGSASLSGNALDNNTSNIEVLPGVTVYDNASFGGAKQTFEIGNWSHTTFTSIDNDDITSMVISPGISVRLCAESGGWGDCQDYSGSVTNVGSLLDQRGSNLEVRAGVTVYLLENYQGVSQSFPQGSFSASALSVVGNDRVSSLVVAPGMRARLCSESGAWGDCVDFVGWVPYVGDLLDNRTSSIQVTPI